MALSCIITKIKLDIGKKYRIFRRTLCILCPHLGVPVGILPYRLVRKYQNDVATRWWKQFDDMFTHLDTIPAYDGQTDGHFATA